MLPRQDTHEACEDTLRTSLPEHLCGLCSAANADNGAGLKDGSTVLERVSIEGCLKGVYVSA